MTENYRVELSDGSYLTSSFGVSPKILVFRLFQKDKEPTALLVVERENDSLDTSAAVEEEFLEIFKNVVESGSAERFLSSMRFGELELVKNLNLHFHFFKKGVTLSAAERIFLGIVKSSGAHDPYYFPNKKTLAYVRKHIKHFKENPPTSVEECVKYLSPSLMEYGYENYDIVRFFRKSDDYSKIIATQKSRDFFQKLYSIFVSDEILDDHLFVEVEPVPVRELVFNEDGFRFIEKFSFDHDFVGFLETLTVGQIKKIAADNSFAKRSSKLTVEALINMCKSIVKGEEVQKVSKELLASEVCLAMVRKVEAELASGTPYVAPPKDEERRSTVRKGPHMYSELMELCMNERNRVNTLQAIKEYFSSEKCHVKNHYQLWDFSSSLLRGKFKSWITSSADSEKTIAMLVDKIGAVEALWIIAEVKSLGKPMSFTKWKKFVEEYAKVPDAPVSWVFDLAF